jgi:hypothetical protein
LGHYAFHCPFPSDLLANLLQAGELPMSDFMDYKQQWEASVAKQTKELERLKHEHNEMRKIILHLSHVERPEMSDKSYWVGFGVHSLATLYSTTVSMCRDMLKELES